MISRLSLINERQKWINKNLMDFFAGKWQIFENWWTFVRYGYHKFSSDQKTCYMIRNSYAIHLNFYMDRWSFQRFHRELLTLQPTLMQIINFNWKSSFLTFFFTKFRNTFMVRVRECHPANDRMLLHLFPHLPDEV